jgi:O-antigen/teichoic acid export membrane protein
MLRITKSHRGLLWLYTGKFGSAAVGLLAIPLMIRILGSAEFGRMSLVLSLQALVVMLDWGTSTLLVRRSARTGATYASAQAQHDVLRKIQWFLCCSHAALLLLGLPVLFWAGVPLTMAELAAAFFLFMASALLNLSHTALIVREAHVWTGLSQLIGTILRFSVAVGLLWVNSSVLFAVCGMALVTGVNLLLNQWRLSLVVNESQNVGHRQNHAPAPTFINYWLIVQSVFSALAIHFDKTLVGLFASTQDVALFFLATSLAMLPITFFAFPMVQYHQSKLLSLAEQGASTLSTQFKQCLAGVSAVTLLSSAGIALLAEPISQLWLGTSAVEQYTALAQMLRPMALAAGIGALGFLPNLVLLFHERYPLQCMTHVVLTSLYLLLVTWVSQTNRPADLAWTFVVYHLLSTTWLWIVACREQSAFAAVLKSSLRSAWLWIWVFAVAWLSYLVI